MAASHANNYRDRLTVYSLQVKRIKIKLDLPRMTEKTFTWLKFSKDCSWKKLGSLWLIPVLFCAVKAILFALPMRTLFELKSFYTFFFNIHFESKLQSQNLATKNYLPTFLLYINSILTHIFAVTDVFGKHLDPDIFILLHFLHFVSGYFTFRGAFEQYLM